MTEPKDREPPLNDDRDGIIPISGSSTRASRVFRIGSVAALAFAIAWRMANPADIAADADLYATPWAMLALLPIFALGAWTYEVTGRGNVDVKGDVVWGVLLALTCYLGLTAALTFF